MKKSFLLFIAAISLTACKKDELRDVQEENSFYEIPLNEIPILENTIIEGNDCTSFCRLIQGSGVDKISSSKQTPDGGYISCGAITSVPGDESDILVMKTDCFGEIEWMRSISNDNSDIGYEIIRISTGGYLLVAKRKTYPSGTNLNESEGQLIKLSDYGEIIWIKEYDFGFASSFLKVKETADGGFVICGRGIEIGSFVFKTNAQGDEVWRNVFGISPVLWDITTASNSTYIVCGETSYDIFVGKLASTGETVWTKTIDKANLPNRATSVVSLGSEIFIGGINQTGIVSWPGFAMKMDADGNEIWYKSLETEGLRSLDSVALSQENDLLVAGENSIELSLVKLSSSDGSILWENNKPIDMFVSDLQLTDDAGFILSGRQHTGSGYYDGVLIKTDLNGN